MASKADITNLAYSNLGHTANVINIDPPDPSTEAKKAAIFYPLALSEILAAHDWGFATRYKVLSSVGNPDAGWQFRFGLPGDYVKAREITAFEGQDPQPYEITSSDADGTVLQCNVEIPTLKYTALIVVTGRFPPKFVIALSWLLSSMVAGPVLRKKDLADDAREVYMEKLGEAAVEDADADKTSSPRQRVRNYKPRSIKARS